MKYLCTKCALKNDIEKMKLTLDELIYEREADFLDPEIVKLSVNIDRYVNQCIRCNEMINKNYSRISDIKGCHLSFYYYGQAHLVMNMCNYIIRGLKAGEVVYVSMEKPYLENLKKMLLRTGIEDSAVLFYPVEELIMLNSAEGAKALRDKILEFGNSAIQNGYSGVRWIGQPSYAIGKTSKADFLKFEDSLNYALKDSVVSILCIYDVYDYMNGGRVIDEDIINGSFSTHTHLLSEFEISKL